MAGSAFYGYALSRGPKGRWVAVRLNEQTRHVTGNWYKTKGKAQAAARKANALLKRMPNPGKMIPLKGISIKGRNVHFYANPGVLKKYKKKLTALAKRLVK